MNLIALVDNNWGIGNAGDLLVDIPEDKRLINEESRGKVLITGRRSYEAMPNRFPTLDRKIIVMSKSLKKAASNVDIAKDLDECMKLIEGVRSEDIYVVGGAEIFKELMRFCDTADITKVDYDYDADKFLDNLDESADWQLVAESDEHTYFNVCYTFRKYKRSTD